MALKIVIADDHEVVRMGLRAFLKGDAFKIVGEAANGRAALKLVQKAQPNVVLLDVRMPDGDGIDCLARIKLNFPQIAVVMFSAFDVPNDVARCVALGASGYLLKNSAGPVVRKAILAAAAGEMLWSREELRRVSGALSSHIGMPVNIPLTKRESDVLKQLTLGLTNKEIANLLEISFETVKEHVQHILQKLGVTDRTQAAIWAVRNKLA